MSTGDEHQITSTTISNNASVTPVVAQEVGNEIRSELTGGQNYSWYHGNIQRRAAEDLMQEDGDFLVRESTANDKEYVLTCKYKSAYYHFKITEVVAQTPTNPTVQYYLEGQNFDSLPALVSHFDKGKSPVSRKTGVILGQAVNRTISESTSEAKYASLLKGSRIKSDLQRPTSQSDGQSEISDKHQSFNTNNSSNILPAHNMIKNVPPKPSRVPSMRGHIAAGPFTEFNQVTNGLPSSVSASSYNSRTGMENTEFSQTTQAVSMRSKPHRLKWSQKNAADRRKRASCFKPSQYHCTMLSSENPPLEQHALSEMKTILLNTDPFKLARHLTFIDCTICRVMEGDIENIFLPHASQLRQDILERYQCIAFWVAICVVKCTSGNDERTEMMNKFIQVANELVHSMGNVFGFSAVMHGLSCPQLSSATSLWELLQLKYTNNAVTFSKKLRPLLRQLDQGKEQIRIGLVCIPHIMPLVRLLEHRAPGIPHAASCESPTKVSSSSGSLHIKTASENEHVFNWWENLPDESFDSLLYHLHFGRLILMNADEFRKIANSKFIDFKQEPKICEMFTTDFQMRLLFGFRSSESPQKERFHKFDRIITALLRLIND